jgi:hypothetical protein
MAEAIECLDSPSNCSDGGEDDNDCGVNFVSPFHRLHVSAHQNGISGYAADDPGVSNPFISSESERVTSESARKLFSRHHIIEFIKVNFHYLIITEGAESTSRRS